MARLRSDNVFGTTTDDPLTDVATTLNAAGLANLAAVAGSDVAVITLDPNRVNGAPEIVYVTAHTGSATSATILRGQEGTAARAHPSGTFWVHAPTALDLALGQMGYAQVTADQAGITTEADLSGLSVTWTATASRVYRITGHVFVQQLTNTAAVVFKLTDGSDAEVQRLGQVQALAANASFLFEASHRESGLSGSITRKLRLFSSAASVTALAAATRPNFVLVEDIGAA